MELFSIVVLYFSATAFGGWILETLFRSFQARRFVNPGFLQGPFVVVYGFGAVGIYLTTLLFPIEKWGLWSWLVILLVPSLIEYVAGWFTEVFFHLKLWDYAHLPFNLHGKICLQYSLLWGVLAVMVVYWIQPFLLSVIYGLPTEWRWLLTGWLSMYLVVDFWFSAGMYQRYAHWISHLKENLTQFKESLFPFSEKVISPLLSRKETYTYFHRLLRPIKAFPYLTKQLNKKIKEIPESLQEFLKHFLPKE